MFAPSHLLSTAVLSVTRVTTGLSGGPLAVGFGAGVRVDGLAADLGGGGAEAVFCRGLSCTGVGVSGTDASEAG